MIKQPKTKYQVYENLIERMVDDDITLKEAIIKEVGTWTKEREQKIKNSDFFYRKLELKKYARALTQDDMKGTLAEIMYEGKDKDRIQAARTLNDIYGACDDQQDNNLIIEIVGGATENNEDI